MKRNYSTLASIVFGALFIVSSGKALQINEQVGRERMEFNSEYKKESASNIGYTGIAGLTGILCGLSIKRASSRREYQNG